MAGNTKFLLWLLLLSTTSSSSCFGSQLDIRCLKTVKQSVTDPNGTLESSWNFDNTAKDFICQFIGPIPLNITRQEVTYLTFLDLSYNRFSGEIPIGICNMDLNVLNIQHNQLGGQIPRQLDGILRLTSLSVADNQLSGLIPSSLSKFQASNFAGNQGLCGPPLDDCGNTNKASLGSHRINDEFIIGSAAGFVEGFVVAFYFPHIFIFSQRLHPYV
ncbi:hypothetical protein SETIT_5G410200v2 [Setaria italica]|uniref:Leucine-rich repeat-containing N-terminal plant-type domain-containing protein n=1 Tax=Setaria italica TaxID=4555 RepID=A0A368REL8_SETIT|nr:hypothetical protein SETIT_5G410200v2 [Setaria italica]